MPRATWKVLAGLGALLAGAPPALPCSLCSGNPQTAVTLRQAAGQARMVLYGTMANPRLNPDGVGLPGSGTTDFHIQAALKSDPALGNLKVLQVPRYVPVDPKAPPRFLLFCDVYNNKIDPFRGLLVRSPATVEYVKGAMALDPRDPARLLLFYFHYLDHPDADLANDAFLELAKANDQQIARAAVGFSPDKLRKLLLDKRTPVERLNMYAFLLGACGTARDADLLRSLILRPDDRTGRALDGILGGYIQFRPREGWGLALTLLADARRPFPDRFAVLRTLRFFHTLQPEASRPQVLRGLAALLPQGDIADMAIEDLRRWQMWDLTAAVLAQYGKPTHSAPILRRAILRYALSCPRPEAARFVAQLRRQDAALVADVQESLEFEKGN